MALSHSRKTIGKLRLPLPPFVYEIPKRNQELN